MLANSVARMVSVMVAVSIVGSSIIGFLSFVAGWVYLYKYRFVGLFKGDGEKLALGIIELMDSMHSTDTVKPRFLFQVAGLLT